MNTHSSTFEMTEIPLQKLLAWTGNVRMTGTGEGIGELAASIASVGLLHNLVVKKEARGKFSVIAGGRRLQALSHLAEAGTIPHSFAVPCRVVTSQADLTEVSLSENVLREPMIGDV
jgi:ParB family chromosome partitioning protein